MNKRERKKQDFVRKKKIRLGCVQKLCKVSRFPFPKDEFSEFQFPFG